MAYATYEFAGTRAVGELHDDTLVPLEGLTELGVDTPADVLDAAVRRDGDAVAIAEVNLLPVVPNPSKILCVGLNYRDHILETKRDMPTYPVLFPKYASNLIGAYADIAIPPESGQVDYEGELAIVIGRPGRRIPEHEAIHHVLGYCVANDITMRDFQYRTHQWLQGKAWDSSTPVGPAVVAPDDIDIASCTIRTTVNGQKVQESELSQLIFSVANLVSTISTFTALQPGDIILTGTPGGVGFRRDPQLFLHPGDTVTVDIDGLGSVTNVVRAEQED
ncbi:MAG: fumarylacetoacetate hydrolase family protein [Mycobacterium sp.]